MRESPEGTGDTALQIPSWRPGLEGGSQDVRALVPLICFTVSFWLVLFQLCWGWGGAEPWGHPAAPKIGGV